MNFPDKDQFLQAFGIEPIEEDPSLALFRYKLCSEQHNLKETRKGTDLFQDQDQK